MTSQLDLDLFGYDQPNRAGVFAECERIVMPIKKSIRAEIRIAATSAGFLWGSSVMLESQGHGAMPSVSDIEHWHVMPDRPSAIRKACQELIDRYGKVQTAGAAMVRSWAAANMQAGTP